MQSFLYYHVLISLDLLSFLAYWWTIAGSILFLFYQHPSEPRMQARFCHFAHLLSWHWRWWSVTLLLFANLLIYWSNYLMLLFSLIKHSSWGKLMYLAMALSRWVPWNTDYEETNHIEMLVVKPTVNHLPSLYASRIVLKSGIMHKSARYYGWVNLPVRRDQLDLVLISDGINVKYEIRYQKCLMGFSNHWYLLSWHVVYTCDLVAPEILAWKFWHLSARSVLFFKLLVQVVARSGKKTKFLPWNL